MSVEWLVTMTLLPVRAIDLTNDAAVEWFVVGRCRLTLSNLR